MIRALALGLLLTLPFPARASETFDDVMTALEAPLSTGDTQAAYTLLSGALRDARVGGWLTPDWAIFYAMQADFARLDQSNPSYALQLTEDGLALIAGDPEQAGFTTALKVSQAYALADLGRFQDAAQTAQLALPEFAASWGEDDARDLADRIQLWSDGELSDFNTAATDLARRSLDRAYAASAKGEHGRAIAAAASAILPMGTDLSEADVRSINTEAEMLIADSLAALGRLTDSANALLRALGHMTRAPWQTGQPIAWWPQRWTQDDRLIMFRLLTDLSTRALTLGYDQIGTDALREAAEFAVTADSRNTLLLLQASLSYRSGNGAEAVNLIDRTRAKAEAAGDRDLVLMTAFYTAVVTARLSQIDGQISDPTPVLAAAEAALAHVDQGGGLDRNLILADTAQILSTTRAHEQALAYARASLAARQAQITARDDTAYASTQARLGARRHIETLLRSAHDAGGGIDPGVGQNCPETPGFVSCVIVSHAK